MNFSICSMENMNTVYKFISFLHKINKTEAWETSAFRNLNLLFGKIVGAVVLQFNYLLDREPSLLSFPSRAVFAFLYKKGIVVIVKVPKPIPIPLAYPLANSIKNAIILSPPSLLDGSEMTRLLYIAIILSYSLIVLWDAIGYKLYH